MSQPDPSPLPPPLPLPVQPLAYSIPFTRRRPGLITAIGVISIIVACMSGLASFGAGWATYGLTIVAKRMARMPSSIPSSTMATSSFATPLNVTLMPADAGIAVNALQSTLALDPSRLREMDRLMRLHGRAILGGDPDLPLTGAGVRAAVLSSTPPSISGLGPATFTTAQGTATIYSDSAQFIFADGSGSIRSSAKYHTDSSSRALRFSTVRNSGMANRSLGRLTSGEIRGVVAAVQRSAFTPLNAAQIRGLRTELSAPAQGLVSPGASNPVLSAIVQSGGSATIRFSTGNVLVLGPAGNVTFSGIPIPKIDINPASTGIVMGESAMSLALAIYLFVVGLMVLRGSFRAPRLLRIYAWIKIPLSLLATAGIVWMMVEIFASIARSSQLGTAAPAAIMGVFWGIIIAAVGLAYPIALLIVVRTRTVRDYFSSTVRSA
jgi:hypothetical protein